MVWKLKESDPSLLLKLYFNIIDWQDIDHIYLKIVFSKHWEIKCKCKLKIKLYILTIVVKYNKIFNRTVFKIAMGDIYFVSKPNCIPFFICLSCKYRENETGIFQKADLQCTATWKGRAAL